jgi:hypothetical protein
MRRDQLEHAIRTACQIIGRHEAIVVGSQAILRTFREDQLPADATMSVEIDILPIADDNSETERLADLIEGVDLTTSALPTGWRGRLVKVQNAKPPTDQGAPDPLRAELHPMRGRRVRTERTDDPVMRGQLIGCASPAKSPGGYRVPCPGPSATVRDFSRDTTPVSADVTTAWLTSVIYATGPTAGFAPATQVRLTRAVARPLPWSSRHGGSRVAGRRRY